MASREEQQLLKELNELKSNTSTPDYDKVSSTLNDIEEAPAVASRSRHKQEVKPASPRKSANSAPKKKVHKRAEAVSYAQKRNLNVTKLDSDEFAEDEVQLPGVLKNSKMANAVADKTKGFVQKKLDKIEEQSVAKEKNASGSLVIFVKLLLLPLIFFKTYLELYVNRKEIHFASEQKTIITVATAIVSMVLVALEFLSGSYRLWVILPAFITAVVLTFYNS